MQPKLLKHVVPLEGSFKVWENASPYRHNPWHYHPEYEITLIERGSGTRFVGDHIEKYNDMDLVLLGGDLPHEWRSEIWREKRKDYESSSIAIHFLRNFPGRDFYDLTESMALVQLLDRARFGLKFTDKKTIDEIRALMHCMLQISGFERLIAFFRLLGRLASDTQYKILCSKGFSSSFQVIGNHKIRIAIQWIMNNFKEMITLSQISDKVHMTPEAFCRFFKKSTGKTFVQYLNEVRTGYSKKMLCENELTVAQIAYESGFRNLSNYNKQFKKLQGTTPNEYRRMYVLNTENQPFRET